MMMTDTIAPPDHDELAAREQIRELVAAYTHLGDSGRIDQMVKLFAPDATLETADGTYHGPDEIEGFFRNIVDGRSEAPTRTFVRHHISNVTILLDSSDVAHGASYWLVTSDDGFESSGRYRDQYRRASDGTWVFHHRKIGRDPLRSAGTQG
jgi:ketosteroid isomerase-like protein